MRFWNQNPDYRICCDGFGLSKSHSSIGSCETNFAWGGGCYPNKIDYMVRSKIALMRFAKAFAVETIDMVSLLLSWLSHLSMYLSWLLFSKLVEYRSKRGFDVSKFEEELRFEQVYVMALQLKTPRKTDPDVQCVWRQYAFLSKRQAYKVLDEWKRQRDRYRK